MRIRLPRTSILMNNYLSIGVDALVTYNFHKARESPFYLISSRIINKLIYFSYGTKDVLERQCQNLHKKLELYMDGVKIELPEIGENAILFRFPNVYSCFHQSPLLCSTSHIGGRGCSPGASDPATKTSPTLPASPIRSLKSSVYTQAFTLRKCR